MNRVKKVLYNMFLIMIMVSGCCDLELMLWFKVVGINLMVVIVVVIMIGWICEWMVFFIVFDKGMCECMFDLMFEIIIILFWM